MGLFSGKEQAGVRSLRRVPAAVFQHLLIDFDNSLSYSRSSQMPYLFPPIRSFAMAQDVGEPPGELLDIRLRDVTSAGIANDVAHVANIG